MIEVKINEKPLLTPAKNPLVLHTQALADAIAGEWKASPKYSPSKMPLTALAYTAIDRIAGEEENIIEAMLVYVDTDTLAYRATDKKLEERERNEWDPILAWAKKRFGVTWQVTTGIHAPDQSPMLHQQLREYLEKLDPMRLAGFSLLASLCSSLALAIAVTEKHISGEEAFRLSRLEEDFQAEQWGRDDEAEIRAARLKEEILSVKQFLCLLDVP